MIIFFLYFQLNWSIELVCNVPNLLIQLGETNENNAQNDLQSVNFKYDLLNLQAINIFLALAYESIYFQAASNAHIQPKMNVIFCISIFIYNKFT